MEIENKKARHDYFIEDTIECGIELFGNEVKSIRDGKASIKDSWARIQNGELVVRGMHISAWKTSNLFDIKEDREKRLLAHKKEIRKLEELLKKDGISLIPLKVYFNKYGKCKVLLGICKGKKEYDKRETLKEREVKRNISRTIKNYNNKE